MVEFVLVQMGTGPVLLARLAFFDEVGVVCPIVGQKYPARVIPAAIVFGSEWYPQVPSCISFMTKDALSLVMNLSSGLLKPLLKSSLTINVYLAVFLTHPFSWLAGTSPFSRYVTKGLIHDSLVMTSKHSVCVCMDGVVSTCCSRDL